MPALWQRIELLYSLATRGRNVEEDWSTTSEVGGDGDLRRLGCRLSDEGVSEDTMWVHGDRPFFRKQTKMRAYKSYTKKVE